mmetsp:Transcript_525/g.977  ORF Transcript_525/g.977 Transcript_525/m.977 type:complete len:255 (-) Transcript_525:171-935(-)
MAFLETHVFEIVISQVSVGPAQQIGPSVLLKFVDEFLQSPRFQQLGILRFTVVFVVLFVVDLIGPVSNLLAHMNVRVLVGEIVVRDHIFKQTRSLIHAMRHLLVLIKQHVVQLNLAYDGVATAGTIEVDQQVAVPEWHSVRIVAVFAAQNTALNIRVAQRQRFNHRETPIQLVEVGKHQTTTQHIRHLLMRALSVLDRVHVEGFVEGALDVFGLSTRALHDRDLLLSALFLHFIDEFLERRQINTRAGKHQISE